MGAQCGAEHVAPDSRQCICVVCCVSRAACSSLQVDLTGLLVRDHIVDAFSQMYRESGLWVMHAAMHIRAEADDRMV